MEISRSRSLYEEALRLIPGGVNSPVRAFRAVGGEPLFIERGEGCRVWDVDGNVFVDYVGSWGPLILGHAPPGVVEAVGAAARHGTSFGAPTRHEVELARLVRERMPSVEQVRFVSSGTEATMSALRVARGFTGREKIVKFEGCYHGHADGLLARAGSGQLTLGLPDSPGVPAAAAANTLTARYNDLASVEELFASQPGEIAAVIVEPVAGNMGVVPPAEGFLAGLRALAEQAAALLVFDEVITGFRIAPGGAQQRYGVRADLTCLGKVIGGGLPVGAYGGRRDVMAVVAPLGPVYQAGTLAGNPLAMCAGLATLAALDAAAYERLERLGAQLGEGLLDAARRAGVAVCVNRVGSMLTLFLTDQPVVDYASAKRADTTRYAKFFHGMLEGGFAFAPSQFEAAFVSLAHDGRVIDATVEAAFDVLRDL